LSVQRSLKKGSNILQSMVKIKKKSEMGERGKGVRNVAASLGKGRH